MARIHQGLPYVIGQHEYDPWQTEEKDETIEDEERGKSWFPGFFIGSVEPENL
jgi:hypothetical protein